MPDPSAVDARPVVDLSDASLWQDPAAALAPAREDALVARTARGEAVVLRYAETERLRGGMPVNDSKKTTSAPDTHGAFQPRPRRSSISSEPVLFAR